MDGNYTISICLGSSCFARNNRNLVNLVNKIVSEKKIEHIVNVRGSHCQDNCEKGPCMRINQEQFTQLTHDKIEQAILTRIIEKES